MMTHCEERDRRTRLAALGARLAAMGVAEATTYAVPDYLDPEHQRRLQRAGGEPPGREDCEGEDEHEDDEAASAEAAAGDDRPRVCEPWRERICEWCYGVVDHFDLDRGLVALALSFLDRYLAVRAVDRRLFQLAALTSLYLATKLHHGSKIRLDSFVELSRGHFSAAHLEVMEGALLHGLGWRCHPPTARDFVRELLPLVPGNVPPRVRCAAGELAAFLTELAVCDYWFVARARPSSIALAALRNALELHDVKARERDAFLGRAAEGLLGSAGAAAGAGAAASDDPEVAACHARLREIYVAGEYSPDLGLLDASGRSSAASPDGVEDGPAAEAATAAARAATSRAGVSPDNVLDGPDAAEDPAVDARSDMDCP